MLAPASAARRSRFLFHWMDVTLKEFVFFLLRPHASEQASITRAPTEEKKQMSTNSITRELTALRRQNEQLAYLRDQAQIATTAQRYRRARIQTIRSLRGALATLYSFFAVFLVIALAATLPTGASTMTIALRGALALLVLVFLWTVPTLAGGISALAAATTDMVRARTDPYRIAATPPPPASS
jgi:hypothetical protein